MKFAAAALASFAHASSIENQGPFLKKKYTSQARQEFSQRQDQRRGQKQQRKAFEISISVTSAAQECNPTSVESTLSCPSETYCVPVGQQISSSSTGSSSGLGGLCSRLGADTDTSTFINTDNTDNPNSFQECNPTSQDADVGILSCGGDNMCLRHTSSSLGGMCVPLTAFIGAQIDTDGSKGETENGTNKRGYSYCDPSSPYFGVLDCDCTGFNTETQEGSFVCSYSYCFGALSECCEQTCADITLTYVGSAESFTYETCYAFKSPYPQTFCYGQTVAASTSDASCFTSFNNESCESCHISNSSCTSFSCDAAGFSGERCVQDFYPDILTTCFAECSTCHVCPNNPNDAVPNEENPIGFSNFTCGYVDQLGEMGMWGGPKQTECINVREVAQKTCCQAIATSSPVEQTSAPTPTPIQSIVTQPPQKTLEETSIPGTTESQTNPVETESPTSPAENWGPASSCSIRIETSKCKELLKVNHDFIPCSCESKCITFINGKFDKCDGGTSIAGVGSIVAGCTFDMAFSSDDVPCNREATQSAAADASSSPTSSPPPAGLISVMSVLLLLAAWLIQ